MTYPRHLRRRGLIALVVGTILFAINQLDVVLRGDAGVAVWAKVAITYLVPFCVSNMGILVATRRSGGGKDPKTTVSSRHGVGVANWAKNDVMWEYAPVAALTPSATVRRPHE